MTVRGEVLGVWLMKFLFLSIDNLCQGGWEINVLDCLDISKMFDARKISVVFAERVGKADITCLIVFTAPHEGEAVCTALGKELEFCVVILLLVSKQLILNPLCFLEALLHE